MKIGANTATTVIVSLIALLAASCGHSGEKHAGWNMQDTIPNDEAVLTGRLDNGLRYYIRQNDRPENRAELRLIVNAGSIQESEKQCGIAHFTEHLLFTGTENYTREEMRNFFELSGMKFGPHINATTTFDETVFKLQPRTDSARILKESFNILSEWAHAAAFDSARVEDVRNAIMDEWHAQKSTKRQVFNKYLPTLFHGSKYAERLPIGRQQVLQQTCIDSIRAFYKNWYRPNLMAVVAVGDFNVDSVERYIKSNFQKLENPKKCDDRTTYDVPEHDSVIVSIVEDPGISFSQVLFYYKTDVKDKLTVGDFEEGLKAGLVENMMKQRYDELKQRETPPIMFGGLKFSALCRGQDAFVQYGIVDQMRITQGFQAMATEIERVRQHGFTQGELQRSKENLLSDYLNKHNESDKRASRLWIGDIEDNFLRNEVISHPTIEYEIADKLLPEISLEDVNESFRNWTPHRNLVIVVTASGELAGKVPSRDGVLHAFDSIAQVKLPHYVDTFRNEALSVPKVNKGQIVEEERIRPLNITKWTLSNGAEVVIKPTNFKNDEILFSAISPGGTSLYDRDDYKSIMFLSRLISMSGVGSYSQSDLQKILSDKNLELIPVIDETHEGMHGKSTPRDLETLLKLNYLYFTSPRKDKSAFQSFKETQKMIYGNLEANPDFFFYNNLYKTLYQDHPRVQLPTEAELDSFDLNRMIGIYRERFSNAGDFTFLFVGNINIDHLKPLVEEYIGGLPATDEQEEFKDHGMRLPEKPVEKVIEKGQESRTVVNISFTGDYTWNFANRMQLDALGEMLKIGLREAFRTSEYGAYLSGVKVKKSEFPVSDYRISIQFTCPPEQTQLMIDEVMETVSTYREDGPGQVLARKVRESLLRTQETSIEENMYWLKMLVQYYKHHEDPVQILESTEVIREIDENYLQETAVKYLDKDRLVKLVMHPVSP